MSKKRVCIICGGYSAEREVSLMSAESIYNAIDKEQYIAKLLVFDVQGNAYHFNDFENSNSIFSQQNQLNKADLFDFFTKIDIVFPIIHGSGGEDGTLQGFLEYLDLPYVGSGVLASALCMDKAKTKKLLKLSGIPALEDIVIKSDEYKNNKSEVLTKITESLALPIFIKPTSLGSSIGISKVKSVEELEPALDLAFSLGHEVLAERGLERPRELECAVIGNHQPEAMAVGEIIPSHEIYDYEAKYSETALSKLIVPADIDADLVYKIKNLALRAYKILGISGLARVDFLLDVKANEIYFNEVNTLPGFTKYSMHPRLCQAAGLSYSDLISKLIVWAEERYHEEKNFFKR